MRKARPFVPIILAVLLAGSGSYAFPGQAEVSDLQEITFVKAGAAVEVSIRVRGEFGNDVFKLTKPERLVFDLSPIDTISATPQTEIYWGGILRVRAGKFKTQVARLVFDLETAAVNYRI
ncbi:MAG: AMIN domain-containing protein, partial [Candidatus Aminicenantes bacterium]|nr:AMIN domain-containing protein [Candidatus Aminicenantes bacterium]